jgi:hypothetical protein
LLLEWGRLQWSGPSAAESTWREKCCLRWTELWPPYRACRHALFYVDCWTILVLYFFVAMDMVSYKIAGIRNKHCILYRVIMENVCILLYLKLYPYHAIDYICVCSCD